MSDGNWFAPERFGYGAGLPISWQGWAVLIVYIAVVALAGVALLPKHWAVWATVIALASVLLTVMCARHTRGGWKWRWNGRD